MAHRQGHLHGLREVSAEDRTPRRQRVVFVDWWGVLSLDPYWRSIRTDPSHLLHAQLEIYIGGVLARNDPRGMAWMRGAISSDRIVSAIGPTSDTDRDTTLLDTLVRDIESMTVNTELTALLADLRSRAFVVGGHRQHRLFRRHLSSASPRRRTMAACRPSNAFGHRRPV